jgi:outer membrane protein assembly factor BamB
MSKRLYVVDPVSRLYTLDPATGSPNLVGPVGIASVTDIAFHGPTLYGVSFSQFLRLNPDTGAGVVVGALGGSFSTTNGLAVASDGTIYAGTTAGQLIRINPVTGAGALVGNFGGGLTSSGDLAFDSNDILYGALISGGTVVLARINRSTGLANTIGPTGLGQMYGMAFFCCQLYGATSDGNLVNINVVTGNATIIGNVNVFGGPPLTLWGMAVRPCCCRC